MVVGMPVMGVIGEELLFIVFSLSPVNPIILQVCRPGCGCRPLSCEAHSSSPSLTLATFFKMAPPDDYDYDYDYDYDEFDFQPWRQRVYCLPEPEDEAELPDALPPALGAACASFLSAHGKLAFFASALFRELPADEAAWLAAGGTGHLDSLAAQVRGYTHVHTCIACAVGWAEMYADAARGMVPYARRRPAEILAEAAEAADNFVSVACETVAAEW